jgi:hypothetical protein
VGVRTIWDLLLCLCLIGGPSVGTYQHPALSQSRREFWYSNCNKCFRSFASALLNKKDPHIHVKVEQLLSVRCLGFAYLCLMNTGFPLHLTVKVVPSAIAPTSNSADARARTSADGLMLETN